MTSEHDVAEDDQTEIPGASMDAPGVSLDAPGASLDARHATICYAILHRQSEQLAHHALRGWEISHLLGMDGRYA